MSSSTEPTDPIDTPEPIAITAERILRTPKTAIRLAKRGLLRASKDDRGRWVSTERAALEFMGMLPPLPADDGDE